MCRDTFHGAGAEGAFCGRAVMSRHSCLDLSWNLSTAQQTGTWVGDVEIFFEAVELKKVGKFESPDIPVAFADFPLEFRFRPVLSRIRRWHADWKRDEPPIDAPAHLKAIKVPSGSRV